MAPELQVSPDEFGLVDRLLRQHPQASRYRITAQADQIEIYERPEFDVSQMLAAIGLSGGAAPAGDSSPVLRLRFVLESAEPRSWRVERPDDGAPPERDQALLRLARAAIASLGRPS